VLLWLGVLGPPQGEFCAQRLRGYVSTDQLVSNAMQVTRPDLDLASRQGDCESRGARFVVNGLRRAGASAHGQNESRRAVAPRLS